MLEAQLYDAQKMEAIGTLAGGVAHDFNNILSAIMGNVELALLDLHGEGKLSEHLKKILRASHRAKDLVSQILAFSRKEEHVLMPLDMKEVIQDALKLIRASLPATIDIRNTIATEDRIIMADQTQIHQVIMNICTNAQHAMRERGGVLEFRLEKANVDNEFALQYPNLNPEDYLLLVIKDSGHGMPANILERIFNPYFTTKEKGEGTGLGLAIVHTIVQNHGGMIRVLSEPGNGTAFLIFLPRASRETLVQAEKIIHADFPTGSERILVVDDEEDIVLILKNMLERLGYKVTTSLESKAALELFKSKPDGYDAVISDMTMPEMTGEMLIARIKEIRPEIPVLLCTGYSELLPKGGCAHLGVSGILMKPIAMMKMATTLRNVLDVKE
jgi:CheY-like chemotaxis protein/anti-sigma regulatory factor (Ser/Thr protein kinase)